MPRSPKALIIACEKYPKGEDIAQELPGTLDSARGFYRWLIDQKGLKAPDVYVCCDSGLVAGHAAGQSFASTRPGICDAVADLVEAHRDNVDQLYVFFSGHGLGYEQSPQQRGLDLLISTDYRNRKKSGGACINLGELQAQMEIWLGGDDHYYFLDACRTVLKAGEIVPAGLGLALDAATVGDPTAYALYSTKFGETAPVNAKFPSALMAGLRGEGRAKARVNQSWWVRFDRLQKYVEAHVDVPVDSARLGGRDGLIAELNGSFSTKLTVAVEGAPADTSLELKIESSGLVSSFPFQGPAFSKELMPNEGGYGVELLFNGKPLRRLAPPWDPLDLFEPVEICYRLSEPAPARRPRGLAGSKELPPSSRVRSAIAGHVPSSDSGRVVDFSETLGPLTEQNTALWLCILGASRMVNDPRRYSKIGRFPLASFEDLHKDECAVYVLAGLEDASRARVSVSASARTKWTAMHPVDEFKGVMHLRVKVKPGSHLVSFALPDRPPVTFASYALPNRAVLFVITEEQDGKLEARQMLLPIYTLAQYLPPVVTERVSQEGLRLVRYLALQQDRFAKRESLAPADGPERRDLDSLLYGKWLDPLLALTAIYEMARRGKPKDDGAKMREAARNLEAYFGAIPDVAVVRRMLDPKTRRTPLEGVPLLRESLVRDPKLLGQLPLPAGLLDYASMWTSWVGAVKGPNWNK